MRFYPGTLDRQEAAGWLERQWARYARDGHGLWLVFRRGTHEPIGQGARRIGMAPGRRVHFGGFEHVVYSIRRSRRPC